MLWIVLVAARWAGMLSVMVLFGASLFELNASAAPKGRRKYLVAAAIVAAAAGLAWAACTIVSLTDDVAGLVDPAILENFFLGTSFGLAWLVRFVLLGALVAASLRAWTRALALLSGLLLLSQVWLGHAAAYAATGDVVAVSAYVLHLLAAGVWVGGLVALVAPVFGTPSELLAPTLVRFSQVGVAAVLVIVATGAANAIFHVSDWTALFQAAYGRIILVKSVLLAIATAIAWQNRFRLLGELPASLGALRRNLLVEQVLLALIVGAAAALGLEPPG